MVGFPTGPMFPGIGERVTNELTALAPSSMKFMANSPLERMFFWFSACGYILPLLCTPQAVWISMGAYDETDLTSASIHCCGLWGLIFDRVCCCLIDDAYAQNEVLLDDGRRVVDDGLRMKDTGFSIVGDGWCAMCDGWCVAGGG